MHLKPEKNQKRRKIKIKNADKKVSFYTLKTESFRNQKQREETNDCYYTGKKTKITSESNAIET